MAEPRAKRSRTIRDAGRGQTDPTRAREAFKTSVRRIAAEKSQFAVLAELDDLEMMEAVTELTRKR